MGGNVAWVCIHAEPMQESGTDVQPIRLCLLSVGLTNIFSLVEGKVRTIACVGGARVSQLIRQDITQVCALDTHATLVSEQLHGLGTKHKGPSQKASAKASANPQGFGQKENPQGFGQKETNNCTLQIFGGSIRVTKGKASKYS